MVLLRQPTALLLLSMFCMVHCTIILKESKDMLQDFKNANSFPKSIKKVVRKSDANKSKSIKLKELYEKGNRKLINPTRNQIKYTSNAKFKQEKGKITNAYRSVQKDPHLAYWIAKDQKASQAGIACRRKNGKCISKKKDCKGEQFSGRRFCKKNLVCCVGSLAPKKNSCEALGGSCIKMKKSCNGEKKKGPKYCEKPKRFQCCVKQKCKSKSDCSSLNGECISKKDDCDGMVKLGKNYCASFKCKCCVKIQPTTVNPSRTAVPILTKATTNKLEIEPHQLKTNNSVITSPALVAPIEPKPDSKPLTTVESIITVISDQEVPLPTVEQPILTTVPAIVTITSTLDKTCYQEMDLGNLVHTVLLPSTDRCKVYRRGITQNSKKDILKFHNQYRAKVAMGLETRGNPGPQPAGSNIREMVWNEELANVAQAWANQCPQRNDCRPCRKLCSRDYVTGQNIYFLGTNNETEMWSKAIQAWYDEVNNLDKSVVQNNIEPSPGTLVSLYTQLMWADTYEVGCGAIYFPLDAPSKTTGKPITYKASRLYICNYGPSGNYINRPVYKIGEAASECSNGVSESYPGLCA